MAEPRIPVRLNRLCCPICREILKDPVTIPCGHNFCIQCIQDRWVHEERSNSRCKCPECGHRFPSKPQLIKNTTLVDLVRDTERFDTGSERRNRHSGEATQAIKIPQKRPWSCADTGRPMCRRHSSSLDVYCCTDELVICAVCASAEHAGHTIGAVRGERQRKEEELKNMQMKSKQNLQKQKKKCKKLQTTLEQIQEEARNTEDYCGGVLASIIDALQRHYLSVKELIAAQEEAAAAKVQTSLQSLQGKMEEMRKRSAELDHLAQTDNDVYFLQKWPSLRRLCEKDLHPHPEISEDPLVAFEFTKRAVDEFGSRLEEFCDKELASISQSADNEQQESGGETEQEEEEQEEEEEEEDDMQERCEASTSECHGLRGVNNTLTEQTVEPKTRADFLQYACALSLDPDTAHKDLAISAGDKEVRLGPPKYKNPPVHSAKRFMHRRQVLCKEGLHAERCYYEVEVKGDKVEIALAYEGINRKTRTEQSAFGGNANSWSLDRSKSYSVSHRGEGIKLTKSPSHHRIGVYLEFKKGVLWFYEVSMDSMEFLYKLEADFTEPLYPGFWIGEKCCIRICDLR